VLAAASGCPNIPKTIEPRINVGLKPVRRGRQAWAPNQRMPTKKLIEMMSRTSAAMAP
jgi:hypothetical protein